VDVCNKEVVIFIFICRMTVKLLNSLYVSDFHLFAG